MRPRKGDDKTVRKRRGGGILPNDAERPWWSAFFERADKCLEIDPQEASRLAGGQVESPKDTLI